MPSADSGIDEALAAMTRDQIAYVAAFLRATMLHALREHGAAVWDAEQLIDTATVVAMGQARDLRPPATVTQLREAS